MRNQQLRRWLLLEMGIVFALGSAGFAQDKPRNRDQAVHAGEQGQNRIAREVRHELVMLPYYGVFDNLAFQVDGGTVTLLGQVTRNQPGAVPGCCLATWKRDGSPAD